MYIFLLKLAKLLDQITNGREYFEGTPRVMYAYPLLYLYRPCTPLSKVNLYITVLGGDF